MNEQLRKFSEWMDSEEGKRSMDEYFAKLVEKQKIKFGRFEKLEKYLETHSFDDLLKRMIEENGEERRDYCYNKGYEPYPTNILSLLFDYAAHERDPIEVPDMENGYFPTTIYFCKGYYFVTICGQGCFNRIYNHKKECILQV